MSAADTTRVLTIKHTPCKVVGWMTVAFCVFATAGSWNAGAYRASVFFIAFAALGGYLILSSGSMQIDSDSITYHLPLRSYQIKWSEVRYIEIDAGGGNMVFVGDSKRLAVIGPALWSGKDKIYLHKFMSDQLDKYDMEVRVTLKAMFRLSKNTKLDV
jgi:hypothetical protein